MDVLDRTAAARPDQGVHEKIKESWVAADRPPLTNGARNGRSRDLRTGLRIRGDMLNYIVLPQRHFQAFVGKQATLNLTEISRSGTFNFLLDVR